MLRLLRTDVPQFLRKGEFFESLREDDDGVFEVPEGCFKSDTAVTSDEELKLLLCATRFWGLHKVPTEALMYLICAGGQSGIAEELVEFASLIQKASTVRSVPASDAITSAIKEGLGVEVVRALVERGYLFSTGCSEAAANVGDVESLMYLHAEGCPWDERTTSAAAYSGHLTSLQYALDFGCSSVPHLMKVAAGGGHVHVLQYLHTTGLVGDADTMTTAVMWGKLPCVHFLHGKGCTIIPGLCCVAAHLDRLECLQYLHEKCGQSVAGVTTCAAASGKLRCLQYAHEAGEAWNMLCCEAAARGNHIDCLRYAREHGCSWDEGTLIAATARGSWTCVRYALWHGCPCFKTVSTAVMSLMLITIFVIFYLTPTKNYLHRASQIVTLMVPLLVFLFHVYCYELYYLPRSVRTGALAVFVLVVLPLTAYNMCYCFRAVAEMATFPTWADFVFVLKLAAKVYWRNGAEVSEDMISE